MLVNLKWGKEKALIYIDLLTAVGSVAKATRIPSFIAVKRFIVLLVFAARALSIGLEELKDYYSRGIERGWGKNSNLKIIQRDNEKNFKSHTYPTV